MTLRLLSPFVALAALLLALPAAAFDTAATAAYVVDVNTGTVLLNKDGDTPMPPASMSKLMTIDLLFQALAAGRVQLDTRLTVSTKAKNMGGSTMFLNERDRPTAEQLIQGIIVLSGNDACVTVAEGLAGSEEAFAAQMNVEAQKLGLTNSHFANASGWPDPGQLMSMHDLATLAVHIIKTYPQYYHYFSEQTFAYDGRAPANEENRDPLLGRVLLYDALAMTYRTISVRKDPAAPPITALADYERLCGVAVQDTGASVTPQELRDLLDAGTEIVVIDVREPAEWQINHIDGAQLIPLSAIRSGAGLEQLPPDRIPVLYCKSGVRSAEALAALKRAGFPDARHLRGGILAWAEQFEPDMAMY